MNGWEWENPRAIAAWAERTQSLARKHTFAADLEEALRSQDFPGELAPHGSPGERVIRTRVADVYYNTSWRQGIVGRPILYIVTVRDVEIPSKAHTCKVDEEPF